MLKITLWRISSYEIKKIKKILETKYTCKCLYSIEYIFSFVFINAK